MSQIFTVDPSKINKIRKRMFARAFKISALTFFVFAVPQYFRFGKDNLQLFILTTLALIPIMLLPLFLGVNRASKFYRTLKITLTADGVELTAEMQAYKAIKWGNLIIDELPDGRISLYDKNVLWLNRKWSGQGCIIIQPEMIDKEVLLSELKSHQG